MRKLDYQERVLDTLELYLDALKQEKNNSDKISDLVEANPELKIDIPDFAANAWETLRNEGKLAPSRIEIPHSERFDGIGRSAPNAVLKVPTGGGKTYVAINALSRIFGRWLNKNTGFVLWIVPNEAIYSQTLKRLKDRQDPYRQMLDRISAGRVKIMEKSDRLDSRDVEGQLCVMLLMLQSANRETKDTLKMFQDRGDVSGFTPDQGDQKAHSELLEAIPNLQQYDLADGTVGWQMVKDSLGNALRIIRPVVVMDEGHKAVSDLAFNTLYGFNPSFVLELTATPHDVKPKSGANPHPGRPSNVLVEVTGIELDREGMIKMPLNLETRQGNDWKATLNTALGRLNALQKDADQFLADSNRYIRPIMLIQVERTGQDQRGGAYIHSEDVKDWLLAAGLDEAEIAIKTSDTNDLKSPENQNLLSPTNRVRAIITKQALQEGWDCPFAYLLCSLAANSNLNAMTQLVGRILRQPNALKTGVASLDECHVITHQAGTADVVKKIKQGLESDGLGDLVVNVTAGDGEANVSKIRKIPRRNEFRETDIYLPKVLWIENQTIRNLDYETDILAAIDWRDYDPKEIIEAIPDDFKAATSQMQRISLSDDGANFKAYGAAPISDTLRFDPAYAVRVISDYILNPFIGRDIVGKIIKGLEQRGFDKAKLGKMASLIIELMRNELDKARNERAEILFKAFVDSGNIQFKLRVDGNNWQMPDEMLTSLPDSARQLVGENGGALEKSLFMPVYEAELNGDEQNVAVYLDNQDTLKWWHRNVARQHYGLQGWKRGVVYPDFVFAISRDAKQGDRIIALETKGDQLDNADTAYKRDLLNYLTDNFAWDQTAEAGKLELVKEDGATLECSLVLMSEWKAKLPELLETK